VSQNKVIIFDNNKIQLEKSSKYITGLLDKEIQKGTLKAEDKDKLVSNYHNTTNIEDMKKCSIVIEVLLY
jgi:3-hydroxyacyl-CoA dehydrogenase